MNDVRLSTMSGVSIEDLRFDSHAPLRNDPSTYRVDGIPEFFLIDQQGRLVKAYQGFGPDMPDSWETELQRILSAPQ